MVVEYYDTVFRVLHFGFTTFISCFSVDPGEALQYARRRMHSEDAMRTSILGRPCRGLQSERSLLPFGEIISKYLTLFEEGKWTVRARYISICNNKTFRLYTTLYYV